MTVTDTLCQESIELEALLISRQYLYELAHKLFGGTPDEALLAVLLGPTTADVVEEFAGENPSMAGLGRFLQDLGSCVDRTVLLDQACDEYTRLFIGPGALPCHATESPYLTGDATAFQENTLAVRAIYRDHGLVPRRLMRIPDDHIAMICAYLAAQATRATHLLIAGKVSELAACLRDQQAFVDGHLLTWVDDFARCARRSKTAVLYPQMIEAVAAFAHNDADFLSEASLWSETVATEAGPVVEGGLGAPCDSPEAAIFAKIRDVLAALRATHPYGIEDYELVEAGE